MTVLVRASLGRLKQAIAAAGLALTIIVPVLAVAVVTAVILVTATGADPRDAFTAADPTPADIERVVTWQDDERDLIRSVEPSTRRAVATAWVRGLEAVDHAVDGDDGPLHTWYSGPALEQLTAATAAAGAVAGPVGLHHELQTWFYSLDGQIMGLRVESSGLLEVDGSLVGVVDGFDVVAVLRDGNWRIEHLVSGDPAS